MRRKDETVSASGLQDWVQSAQWVAEQFKLALHLLALDPQHIMRHFPPGVNIISELLSDYDHFWRTMDTYWAFSQAEASSLNALQDFFVRLDASDTGSIWTLEALLSDPRWDEIRHLARQALTALHWPIEIPQPEPNSRGWKERQ